MYSAVNDEDYTLQEVISAQAVIGFTQSPLRRAGVGVCDDGAPLRVRLVDGLLESRPRDALLNGANLVAIGDGTLGNWELFQFASAELVGQGTYALSGRLRGQLGTDSVMPKT